MHFVRMKSQNVFHPDKVTNFTATRQNTICHLFQIKWQIVFRLEEVKKALHPDKVMKCMSSGRSHKMYFVWTMQQMHFVGPSDECTSSAFHPDEVKKCTSYRKCDRMHFIWKM